MTTSLEELERRVEALEQDRLGFAEKGALADLRRAVATISTHVEDTRLRMTRVEDRLERVVAAVPELVAGVAVMRQDIGALRQDMSQQGDRLNRLESDMREMKADVAGLRRDMPSIVAEAMREVLRHNKG
jgi:chromosome segregation ATPase